MHFSVPATALEGSTPLRVDVMSVMRGVDPFAELWRRRTTLALASGDGGEVMVDVLALPDLVQANKTQQDKDWPVIRRLVDASYDLANLATATPAQVAFWLQELRTPACLRDAIARFPEAATASTRPAIRALLSGADIDGALEAERAEEVQRDRTYWAPLRRELEMLRHCSRRE